MNKIPLITVAPSIFCYYEFHKEFIHRPPLIGNTAGDINCPKASEYQSTHKAIIKPENAKNTKHSQAGKDYL